LCQIDRGARDSGAGTLGLSLADPDDDAKIRLLAGADIIEVF
jgi:hypothetical protein